MSRVWVLGAGQLGAMLKHAAQPLAVDLVAVDIEDDSHLDLAADDVITAEREQWPSTQATDQLAAHANFVNRDIFGLVADRVTQKQMLDRLHLPTAPWQLVESGQSATDLHATYGAKVLLKQRSGGFDGRGQLWLQQDKGTVIPDGWHNKVIAEQAIGFDEEVSVVGVRNRAGECYFYPLALNHHQDGILAVTIAPLARLQHLQSQAETMLTSIMDDLDYVGVMGVELFVTNGGLVVNEIAPRVHNSGHWTLDAAHTDQFEQLVRIACGLPLGNPGRFIDARMQNIIGDDVAKVPGYLQISNAKLHLYGKRDARPGRKMGHVTFVGPTP
mgnify:CR=1 FL=1